MSNFSATAEELSALLQVVVALILLFCHCFDSLFMPFMFLPMVLCCALVRVTVF